MQGNRFYLIESKVADTMEAAAALRSLSEGLRGILVPDDARSQILELLKKHDFMEIVGDSRARGIWEDISKMDDVPSIRTYLINISKAVEKDAVENNSKAEIEKQLAAIAKMESRQAEAGPIVAKSAKRRGKEVSKEKIKKVLATLPNKMKLKAEAMELDTAIARDVWQSMTPDDRRNIIRLSKTVAGNETHRLIGMDWDDLPDLAKDMIGPWIAEAYMATEGETLEEGYQVKAYQDPDHKRFWIMKERPKLEGGKLRFSLQEVQILGSELRLSPTPNWEWSVNPMPKEAFGISTDPGRQPMPTSEELLGSLGFKPISLKAQTKRASSYDWESSEVEYRNRLADDAKNGFHWQGGVKGPSPSEKLDLDWEEAWKEYYVAKGVGRHRLPTAMQTELELSEDVDTYAKLLASPLKVDWDALFKYFQHSTRLELEDWVAALEWASENMEPEAVKQLFSTQRLIDRTLALFPEKRDDLVLALRKIRYGHIGKGLKARAEVPEEPEELSEAELSQLKSLQELIRQALVEFDKGQASLDAAKEKSRVGIHHQEQPEWVRAVFNDIVGLNGTIISVQGRPTGDEPEVPEYLKATGIVPGKWWKKHLARPESGVVEQRYDFEVRFRNKKDLEKFKAIYADDEAIVRPAVDDKGEGQSVLVPIVYATQSGIVNALMKAGIQADIVDTEKTKHPQVGRQTVVVSPELGGPKMQYRKLSSEKVDWSKDYLIKDIIPTVYEYVSARYQTGASGMAYKEYFKFLQSVIETMGFKHVYTPKIQGTVERFVGGAPPKVESVLAPQVPFGAASAGGESREAHGDSEEYEGWLVKVRDWMGMAVGKRFTDIKNRFRAELQDLFGDGASAEDAAEKLLPLSKAYGESVVKAGEVTKDMVLAAAPEKFKFRASSAEWESADAALYQALKSRNDLLAGELLSKGLTDYAAKEGLSKEELWALLAALEAREKEFDPDDATADLRSNILFELGIEEDEPEEAEKAQESKAVGGEGSQAVGYCPFCQEPTEKASSTSNWYCKECDASFDAGTSPEDLETWGQRITKKQAGTPYDQAEAHVSKALDDVGTHIQIEKEIDRQANIKAAEKWSVPSDDLKEKYGDAWVESDFDGEYGLNGQHYDDPTKSPPTPKGYVLSNEGGGIPADEMEVWMASVIDAVSRTIGVPRDEVLRVASAKGYKEIVYRSVSGGTEVYVPQTDVGA